MTLPGAPELYARTSVASALAAPAPEGFSLARWVEVRFGDTDLMGHVNNSAYATYFETLRFFCLSELSAPDDLTLVRVEIDYRRPARFGMVLLGAIRVERCGNRSLEFAHALFGDDDELVAQGRSVLVALSGEQSTPLSDELRAAVARLEEAKAVAQP